MKLLIREIRYNRKIDSSDTSIDITEEELFDLSLGVVPFKRNHDDFEIVEIKDDEVILKIKTRLRNGYQIINVRKNETSKFVPLPRKDGLVSFVYEFELLEVNYEKN